MSDMVTATEAVIPDPVDKAGRRRWTGAQTYLLVILTLTSVCNLMDRGIIALLQEGIKRDLGLSDAQLGLISGPAFAIAYSIASFPVARLAERHNRPKLLALALAFWSAMTAFCGLATGFMMLVLLRALVGIGEGGGNPISHSLLADNFPPRQRGGAMALLTSASALSHIIVPVTAGLVAHSYGWRPAFLTAGLPGLVLAVLLWFTIPEPRRLRTTPVETASFKADALYLLRSPTFLCIFVAGAFNGIGIMGTALFTASFLMRRFALDYASVGTIITLFGVGGVIATFLAGWIADRLADARGRSYVLVPAVGAVLCFVFFYLGYSATDKTLSIVMLGAAYFAVSIKSGPNLAAVQNAVPSRMRATAAAFFFLGATVIGTGFGATLVGWISDVMAGRIYGPNYAVQCVGGHAAKGLEAVEAACRTASADGLADALMIIPFFFLAAALFFALAARTMRLVEE